MAAERGAASLDELISDDDDVTISVVTVAELLVGVELAHRRRRPKRATFVELALITLPVEDYDLPVARVHAALLASVRRAGCPRGAHDLLIAATAIARGRILVTADRVGFEGLPGLSIRAA